VSRAAVPPGSTESGNGRYVYGVVPAAQASAEMFSGAPGVHADGAVMLVAEGELAAIASDVPLAEFGQEAIERNLHDEAWLEEKVRAHEGVLEAALGQSPLVPFRFGTIFRSDEQVRKMLRENTHLTDLLERLRGTVELGVKAFLDADEFERKHGGETEEEPGEGGKAYLLRKQRDRRLADARVSFTAACAQQSHELLATAAEDARANPLHRPEHTGRAGEMLLNGAYLVRTENEQAFRATLTELESRYGPDGVQYELTGPWPPYNFVDVDLER
jgi:Gas vesicle synthesis protein GvpL/GvpF